MGGKYVSGWLLDRIGGVRTAQFLMVGLVVFGICELIVPRQVGLWAVVPVVCVTAMLFPVSNAMVVIALPERASWGVGIYRAGLMLFSAVCAGVSGLALRTFSTTVVMLIALAIPLIVVIAQGRASWQTVQIPHRPIPQSSEAK